MKAVKAIVVIPAILALVGGCSSKFIGHKLGAERDEDTPIIETGIPIVMNRPEFQLSVENIKVDNKPVIKSTIAVKWVPDNNQRYTLALDPALFVDSSFLHTFDAEGNFTAGAGTTRSKVVETIKSLGTLSTSVLSLAALFDISSPVKALRDAVEVSARGECTEDRENSHSGIFANIPLDKTDVRSAIVWRWKRYEEIGERASKGDGDKEVLKRIHYVNEQEQNCFRKINEKISIESDAALKDGRESYKKLRTDFEAAYKDNVDGFDLHLMSVASIDGIVNDGRSLVIVALVGADLNIRIFDASGKKVIDKPENELLSGEALAALKLQFNSLPDEPSISLEDKKKIIKNATLITGHTHTDNYAKVIELINERDIVKLKERTSIIDAAEISATTFEDAEYALLAAQVFIIQDEINNGQKQVLDAIINMEEPMWRARHALEYSDHIKLSLKEAMLLSPGSTKRTTKLTRWSTLNTELDFILRTADLRTQINNLEAYLAKKLPDLKVGANVHPYPIEDREKVSSQLVAVKEAYTTVRNKVLEAAGTINVDITPVPVPQPAPCDCPKPPPPTAALELVKNMVIPRATQSFVALKRDELPKDAPSYVLVLESADGLPLLSAPELEQEIITNATLSAGHTQSEAILPKGENK